MNGKNENGLALPLVLIVLLVLSLLGATLWQFSMAETAQASQNQKRIESHYVARAGADSVAEYIIQNPGQAANLIAQTTASTPATGTIGDGNFSVSVSGNLDSIIEVRSYGNVGGVSSAVTLTLNKLTASDLFQNAISQTSNTLLDLTGMDVNNGNVESAGPIDVKESFTGLKYEYSEVKYPSPDFPTLPPAYPNSIDTGNDPITIGSDGWYSSIKSQPNGKVTFNTGGGLLQIMVDDLDVKGDIIVDSGPGNTGRVELFINNTANFQTPSTYNTDPSRFIVYLKEGAEFELIANGDFYGYVYGPKAKVVVQSNGSTVNGAIVAEVIVKNDAGIGPNGVLNFVEFTDIAYNPQVSFYQRNHWSQ